VGVSLRRKFFRVGETLGNELPLPEKAKIGEWFKSEDGVRWTEPFCATA
jgi:hypothetical protein